MTLEEMQLLWDTTLINNWHTKFSVKLFSVIGRYCAELEKRGAHIEYTEDICGKLKEMGLKRIPVPCEMENHVAGFIGTRSIKLSQCLLQNCDRNEIIKNINNFRWCKPRQPPGKGAKIAMLRRKQGGMHAMGSFQIKVRERDKRTDWKTVK